jgi:hypothetical protein
MKMTLLEMTQDILSDMDSDFVNSITDTPDAMQVASVIRTTYYELFALRVWPHSGTLISLESSADSNKPNYLRLPDKVYNIEWIKYNRRGVDDAQDRFVDVKPISPKEFMDRVMARSTSDDKVTVVTDFSGVGLNILTNKAPEICTTFDDEWVVFDSYDSDVDAILQSSKSQGFVYLEPSFTLEDTFVPEMPAKAFPYLLSEAKSVCFNSLKQLPNAKEEQRSRRQRTWLASEKRRVGNYIVDRPNWGRNSWK